MSDQHQPYGEQSGNPYGDQPYGAPAQSGGKGLAITALVLGILALLFSWTVLVGIVAGLVALVLGIVAARRAKQGRGGGRAMAIIGAVLGLIGALISTAIVVAAVAFVQTDSFQNMRDCLESAGDDQAAIDRCAQQFEGDVTN